MSKSSTPSKAQQARELTGDKSGQDLEPLRSGLLIAWYYPTSGKVRVYWPKSVYPSLEAAQEALKAAGLPTGMDFTQYRAAGPFHNLVEMIQAQAPAAPAVDPDDSSTGLSHDAPAETPAPAVKKASGSKAQKATSKAPAKGSWAARNPEKVATIPAAIKAGQHPQTFADANGISLAIAWRLFKAEGWVATGKGGGGKAFSFSGQEQQDEAHAALQCLADIAEAAGVSISRVIREVEATSR